MNRSRTDINISLTGNNQAYTTVYPRGTANAPPEHKGKAIVGITLQSTYDPFGSSKSETRQVKFTWGLIIGARGTVSPQFSATRMMSTKDALSQTVFVELNQGHYLTAKGYQKIFVEITIYSLDTETEVDAQSEYIEQQRNLYETCEDYGDLTITIHEPASEVSSEPPRKRRRSARLNSNARKTGAKIGEIKASSLILRSASDVFKAEITRIKAELSSDDDELLPLDIIANRKEDVEDVLFYIVTNDLKETADPLAVITLAEHYNLNALKLACAMRIIGELRVDNFVESQVVFSKYEIQNGYSELVEFGRRNYEEIEQLRAFNDLSFDFRQSIKPRNSDKRASSSSSTSSQFMDVF